jgi:hypothetical protein
MEDRGVMTDEITLGFEIILPLLFLSELNTKTLEKSNFDINSHTRRRKPMRDILP